MARTQMRLDAITGSIPDLKPASIAQGEAAASFVAADLGEVLEGYAQAIANIHGSEEFTAQVPGQFDHSGRNFQVTAAQLKFIGPVSGSSHLKISGDITGSSDILLDKSGPTVIQKQFGHLDVGVAGSNRILFKADGADRLVVSGTRVETTVLAVLSGAQVNDLGGGDGSLVFRDNFKVLMAAPAVVWDGSKLNVTGIVDVSSVLSASDVKIDGDTPNRLYMVGAAGQIFDTPDATLTGAGAASLLTLAGSGSFAGTLTVQGDLVVNGTTTTVNSTELKVDDINIELAHSPGGEMLNDAGVDGGGITLQSSGGAKTITWSNASKYWVFSEGVQAPSGTFDNLASQLVKADANGKLIDAHAMDFVTGTLNQVELTAGSLAGSVVLSLPQDIDTAAAVTFDSLQLDGLSSNRMVKTDASSGLLVSADIMDFVTGTVNQVELTAGLFGNVVLSTPQDIHSGASPEFLAINLAAYGDLVADGSNLKIAAAAELILSGADGQYQLAEAGDRAAFVSAFGASETIIGAINALAAGSGGGKGKWSKLFTAAPSPDASIADMASAMGAAVFPTDLTRVDVYLNGQMMTSTADYAIAAGAASVDFTFDLAADDVVTVVIR